MKNWACPICHDKGAVRVHYTESPDYDIGICTCAIGQLLRKPKNLSAYAWRVGKPVYYLENLSEMALTQPSAAAANAFEAAGQKPRRCR